MGFNNIPKVDSPDMFLESAFRKARNTGLKKKLSDEMKESQKLASFSQSLQASLNRVRESFPDPRTMDGFYLELVEAMIGIGKVKKSLAAIDWAVQRIRKLEGEYSRKMRKASDPKVFSKQAHGRVASILKQIAPELEKLDDVRKTMRKFPAVKTGMFTVAIAGYPNVGKSSILKALTGSRPDIQNYAFTTRTINMGYVDGIQVIDTPGAFDRDFLKMNSIEKQAYLVITHLAGLIIFVVDETESCGYALKDQLLLLSRVSAMHNDVNVVYSKSDMLKDRQPGISYVSVKTGEGLNDIKKLINQHKADSNTEDHKD